MNLSRLLAPCLLILLPAATVSCGDTTGPETDGGISFSFDGAVRGTFTAPAGTPQTSVEGVPDFDDWSLAAAGDSVGGLVLGGVRRAAPDRGDLFILQLSAARTGSFACSPNADCHGRLLLSVPDHAGLPPGMPEHWFEIVSGETVVSNLDGQRVSGTFSFTARSEGGAGAEVVQVTDGTFDLPLAGAGPALALACTGATATGETCEVPGP